MNDKNKDEYITNRLNRLSNNHDKVNEVINILTDTQTKEEEEEKKKGIIFWLSKHKKESFAGVSALAIVVTLLSLKICDKKDIDPNVIASNPIFSENPTETPTASIKPTVSSNVKESEIVVSIEPVQSEEPTVAVSTPPIEPTLEPTHSLKPDTKPSVPPVTSKAPIEIIPTVHYSETLLTNNDVLVTITSNVELEPIHGWTLSEDKKTLSKIYSQNIEEVVTLTSIDGATKNVSIKINNIDKEFLPLNVTYSTKNNEVTIKITSNEELKPIYGWTLSKNQKTLERTYTKNIEEEVTVKDLAGNTQTIKIKVDGIKQDIINSEAPTPIETYTPLPSSTPEPTQTPEPTPVPTPEPTPEPTRSDWGGNGENGGDGYGDTDDIVITFNDNIQKRIVAYQEMREVLINGVTFEYPTTTYKEDGKIYKLMK